MPLVQQKMEGYPTVHGWYPIQVNMCKLWGSLMKARALAPVKV